MFRGRHIYFTKVSVVVCPYEVLAGCFHWSETHVFGDWENVLVGSMNAGIARVEVIRAWRPGQCILISGGNLELIIDTKSYSFLGSIQKWVSINVSLSA